MPTDLTDQQIKAYTRLSKPEFLNLVTSSLESRGKASEVSVVSEVLLYCMRCAHFMPFEVLASLFCISTSRAIQMFYRQLAWQFCHNSNIPRLINDQGEVEDGEVKKMFERGWEHMEPYYRALANFEDPTGKGRQGVVFNIDATYLFSQDSADVVFHKEQFYKPKKAHVFKYLTITDMQGYIQGVCPVATSNTPASGDGHIVIRYIDLEDKQDRASYMRTFLRGTDTFFPILVVDAGFTVKAHNAPTTIKDAATLAEVCEEEGAIYLHASSVNDPYHLKLNENDKLVKLERDNDNPEPTKDEAAVKFTRLLRKPQEMSFGRLKGMFKLLGAKFLPSSYLSPLSKTMIRKFHLPHEFEKIPRIFIMATAIASMYNRTLAGFKVLYFSSAEHQTETGKSFLKRMMADNPFNFGAYQFIDEQKNSKNWTKKNPNNDKEEINFGNIHSFVNFPKLTPEQINPVAVHMISGPYGIRGAHSVLTYISQLKVREKKEKGEDLSEEEVQQMLTNIPLFHPIQYRRVEECPDDWDEERCGPFQTCTVLRSKVPPSHRSAAGGQNDHWVAIVLGDQPSDRLGLPAPYDRILCWTCTGCPALNALMSWDRHEVAVLMAISFPFLYKPTIKKTNTLNPAAPDDEQSLFTLHFSNPAKDLPRFRGRRSRDRRRTNEDPAYSIPGQQQQPVSSSPSQRGQSPVSTPTSSAPVQQPPPSSTADQHQAAMDTNDGGGGITIDELREHKRFCRAIDPHKLYTLPGISPHYPVRAEFFLPGHLQENGLDNTSHACCLLSIIQAFHRLGLQDKMDNKLVNDDGTIDHALILMERMLVAMPSEDSFSPQMFIVAWNMSGRSPQLGMNEDLTILDGLLGALKFVRGDPRPIMTQFRAKYRCPSCNQVYSNRSEWDGKPFDVVPMLNVPVRLPGQLVKPADLLNTFLDERFTLTCDQCQTVIHDAEYDVTKGDVTIVALNRLRLENGGAVKTMSELDRCPPDNSPGGQLMAGELVAVVSHLYKNNDKERPHWVSYLQTMGGHWWRHDDSHPVARSGHPFHQVDCEETVNLLCYYEKP